MTRIFGCMTSILIFPMISVADPQEIRLIVRGDDMGMTQGSLVAFERAFNHGILTCASIIVPAPWFEGAAELCRKNPNWCTGVHLCLIGEWRGYRWRPLRQWDKVSSLVDDDGFLYGSPDELWSRKPKLEEIDAELRAQIDLAMRKGVNVQYLDSHYVALSSYPGLEKVIVKIGRDYDLPISFMLGEKRCGSIYKVPLHEKENEAIKMLEKLEPGLWLWVCHVGIHSPEQEALIHTDPRVVFTDGGVGPHRAAELATLLSPRIRSVILKRGIRLTNYRELRNEMK